MSTTPIVYKSTDSGAPALSGLAGSLVALLDAVLVSGYGSGSSAKPGAGWVTTFTSTGKRGYRNNPATGSGYTVRIDDSDADPRVAFLRGFSQMSDIDTGLNPIPTTAQLANGSMLIKSSSADGTSRAWVIVATQNTAYLFLDCFGHGSAGRKAYAFGDFDSIDDTSLNNFMITADGLTAYSASPIASGVMSPKQLGNISGSPGAYVAMNAAGATASAPVIFFSVTNELTAYGVQGLPAYPNSASKGLVAHQVGIAYATSLPAGYLKGLYAPLQVKPFGDLVEQAGVVGSPNGTTLLPLSYNTMNGDASNSNYLGQILVDIAQEW